MLNTKAVKKRIHQHNLKIGKHVITTIENRIETLIEDGIKRARKNRRRTLLGRDI